EMNRAMVASAGSLVVLADHTKWGIIGLSAMASLADASVVVSDAGLGEEARDVLATSVGELIIAGSGDPGSQRAAAL
ncbi:MAG: DeoR family transcriptional regulator, partial [Trebonia sp.]